MQGSIIVSGNTLEYGVTQNVFLKKDKVISVRGAFTPDASIGVHLESINGTFTSGYNTYNSIAPDTYFKPDIASQSVALSNDGEATLSTPEGQVYYIDRSWNEETKQVCRLKKPYRLHRSFRFHHDNGRRQMVCGKGQRHH